MRLFNTTGTLISLKKYPRYGDGNRNNSKSFSVIGIKKPILVKGTALTLSGNYFSSQQGSSFLLHLLD